VEEEGGEESSVEGSSEEESSVEGDCGDESSVEGASVEESSVEGESGEECSVEGESGEEQELVAQTLGRGAKSCAGCCVSCQRRAWGGGRERGKRRGEETELGQRGGTPGVSWGPANAQPHHRGEWQAGEGRGGALGEPGGGCGPPGAGIPYSDSVQEAVGAYSDTDHYSRCSSLPRTASVDGPLIRAWQALEGSPGSSSPTPESAHDTSKATGAGKRR